MAVIDASSTDRQLAQVKGADVTGICINELISGGSGAGELREPAPVLAGLKVPLVIDHMGWCPAQARTGQADVQAVLSLVNDSGCWVKLSGAYRMSGMLVP